MSWIQALPRLVGSLAFQFLTPHVSIEKDSLIGKTAIITGGNSGIGFETAKGLAIRGCNVIIVCRNTEKALIAIDKINKFCEKIESKGICSYLQINLADLISVKNCVEEIKMLFNNKKLDFLVCNAGIMLQPYSQSPQGYEIHFATNYLGHFALVIGLLNLLKESKSKIVIITGDICFMENDASPDFRYDYIGIDSYCRSKICNQSFAFKLQNLYPELKVYLVHPGIVNSNLVELPPGFPGLVESFLRPLIMLSSERGAQSSLLCLVTEEIPTGVYFHNCFGITRAHPRAYDNEWSDNLWNLSMKLTQNAELDLL